MDTAAQPQVKVGDILKCTNTGTRIFRGQWDLVDYVIPPDGADFIPFEAVKLFFGDPRSGKTVVSFRDSRGIVGFIPDRSAEVRRLRLLYDHGFGEYTGLEGPQVVWEPNKIPDIRVETLKGERIFTVIDDPSGASVTLAATTQSEEASLRETVRQQGELIRALMERQNFAGNIPDVPEDEPPDMVYDPATEEIRNRIDEDPEADPEIYDELPEDR